MTPIDTLKAYAELPRIAAERLLVEGQVLQAQAEAKMLDFKARAAAAGFTEGSDLLHEAAEQLAALPRPEIPVVEIPAPPAIELPEFNFDSLPRP